MVLIKKENLHLSSTQRFIKSFLVHFLGWVCSVGKHTLKNFGGLNSLVIEYFIGPGLVSKLVNWEDLKLYLERFEFLHADTFTRCCNVLTAGRWS